MPLSGKQWRHITFGTYNSWLPGDPRGFRNRDHRLHSSGDHRHPPPEDEHKHLHAHSKMISADPLIIGKASRLVVLHAIQITLDQLEHRYIAIACCAMHVHVLVELPEFLPEIKKVTGQLKRTASHALRNMMPGRIWARGGDYEPVKTPSHQKAAYAYILRHRKAWVWSEKTGTVFND